MNSRLELYNFHVSDGCQVSDTATTVTLPEGSGGEPKPGLVEVHFGETTIGTWPDVFETTRLMAFCQKHVEAFKAAGITGIEWYPIKITENCNRRLTKITPPRYFWARITGRIRCFPFGFKSKKTDKTYQDGRPIYKYIRERKPIELDRFGCLAIRNPKFQQLKHAILPETSDHSDLMRVLPTGILPYEVCSKRFADLLVELKVLNISASPLRPGYGLPLED